MNTISVVGGDLFHIAARQLGDATQWIRIAQLNRLVDPNIPGSMILQIPDVNPNATGGVATQ